MKLFALAAVAGSFGILGVAAWDAAKDKNSDVNRPKALDRVAVAPAPAAPSQAKAATTVPLLGEVGASKAEFVSAAAASDWTMRTRDYQELMFNARPMVTPSAEEDRTKTDNSAARSDRERTAVAVAAEAPVRAATERAKPSQPRQAPDADALLMTPGRIARIKEALRLTADQETHWPPIEVALREIGKQQLEAQRRGHKLPKNALSPEVTQQLYWSAGPLIMSLRPDQKNEARSLARSMGLERVASLL